MMYYIVTGAAGFIGSKLVEGLNRRGITEIIAVDTAERKIGLSFRGATRAEELADAQGFSGGAPTATLGDVMRDKLAALAGVVPASNNKKGKKGQEPAAETDGDDENASN